MTNNQLTSTHLAVKSELDGYKIHASRGQATAMAMVRLFESIDRDLEELQERRKAAAEPVVPATLPCSVELKPGLIIGKGCKTETLLVALQRRADYYAELDAMTPEERAERDANIAAFKTMLPQPALVVPDEIKHRIGGLDWGWEGEFNRGWNACRAAMLQENPVCTCPSGDGSLRWPCPVHAGNPPVIPDAARDALEKALAAMEFMGDTLNNLDAVCSEDVELVAPAFDAVRSVLAAAPQSPGSEPATVPGKWIPVSERLPEDSGRYWCYVEEQNDLGKSHYQWNCSWNGDRWWVESEGGGIVTHWMPLPAAPQEVNRE
ncbi:DUF551 domain-containing protein [Klebsiella pneumoniae subsp. pneumoniae]|nr:DUF551 domain-containing protein [Klebsiella pneumoniae]MCS6661738.1 DUF551 domain-containing protein [Klebsiella pneumoniae subsp. pneumoniae]